MSDVLTYLRQIWRSEDLRTRILWTVGLLVIYRIVAHITVPGVDPNALAQYLNARGGAGSALGIFSALTGGGLDNFSLVMLGLSPYINASIIIQLCTVIFPKLEALSKEGAQGQQELNRYMRWISLPLAFLQSYGFLLLLNQGGVNLVDTTFPGVLLPMLYVSAGSIFLMWLGEILTEKGIGNGTSMIIFTGIVAAIPTQLGSMLAAGQGGSALALFGVVSVLLLIAVVLFTDAHRLIPITYANQGAGRGVQGNIPVRLNQAGMIPIIFAVSLITLPSILAQFLQTAPRFAGIVNFVTTYLSTQNISIVYLVIYFLLVLLFNFFYVSVTFKPTELAETIQKRGGFIPGVRPGPQTAKVLERTSNLLNLWGGVFLGVVAIIPLLFTRYSSLGSTELLISGSGMIIIVGVVMELIRIANAQMLAHDYEKLV
jgi:preprotein translocase subunit SecY